MGHAPDGSGPDGTGAPDLERALRADATDRDGRLGPPQVRRQLGSPPPGAPPERGGALGQPALPLLLDRLPELADGGAGTARAGTRPGTRTRSPGRPPVRPAVRARRAARSSTTSSRVRPLRRATSSPSTTWASQMCVAEPVRRARPVDGHHLHRVGLSPPASACSLVTVFQFRVVLTTPSRRSRRVPVSLVPA